MVETRWKVNQANIHSAQGQYGTHAQRDNTSRASVQVPVSASDSSSVFRQAAYQVFLPDVAISLVN